MDTKSSTDDKITEVARELAKLPPIKPSNAFLEQFIWLIKNASFQKEIASLRANWGINNYFHDYTLTDIITFIQKNRKKTYDVFSIAYRCKLYKGKHRTSLFYTLISYIYTNRIILHKFPNITNSDPLYSISVDRLSSKIELTIHLYTDTELSNVNKAVKDSWKEVKKIQRTIKGKRYTPVKNFLDSISYLNMGEKTNSIPDLVRMLGGIKSVSEDKKDEEYERLDENKTFKHISRIARNIHESFA